MFIVSLHSKYHNNNIKMTNFFAKVWPLRRYLAFVESGLLRNLSKDAKKDQEGKDLIIDDETKYQKGILHDKQKSIQEESYFHKEEMEQLKALKKKVINKENENKEKNEKKD